MNTPFCRLTLRDWRLFFSILNSGATLKRFKYQVILIYNIAVIRLALARWRFFFRPLTDTIAKHEQCSHGNPYHHYPI